ncbi:DNA-3-methyladenine glycosylase 2 family protein [Leptolyngbya sp. FACHB-671]|uniref:DNA-3-methyladenine glycosylase family protein n=1 Tax=Leptolyngbya sp. FACHB-671 TaxID=2692812 RepID=UPI001684F746|nr:DNA-3-methyladenine glycosylase [Leptolyngbya sp. FACHB-671]MBD1871813.1 DNA-3-methyladenine glycosylase 2 family protein [Cyanobacteria bacterium FACHB-471]MBD2069849.1 DNA-3-methyladenine glycosylase 2 family protein [Leptolyngbya sp. FACHB-671]
MDYSTAIAFLIKSDPVLGKLIQQVGPCQLGEPQPEADLLFSLSKTILHQQLSTKVANVIHGRFLQLYAERLPTAMDILNTPDETLRGVGISRSKIIYLKDLAQKILDGLPTMAELAEMEDEAIIQTLTQVKGIGRWSAQMLLIFRLGRLDVLPVDDLGVRAGIRKLYQLDDLPTKKMVELMGQKWKPYGAIVSWYLWRSLDMQGIEV